MGLISTKSYNGEANVKRLRVGDSAQTDSVKSKETTLLTNRNWEALPVEILVRVYQLLSVGDKYSASLTCKAWSLAFSRPEAWREATFYFNGKDNKRALHIAEFLAPGLRHLTIDCRDISKENENSTSASISHVYDFLKSLQKCQDCKLFTLRLINFERLLWWRELSGSQNIFSVLTDIVTKQDKLIRFSLSWAGFPAGQGLYILSRVACSNSSTITDLNIIGFFSNVATPSITLHLKLFTNLRDLSVSYEYINDATLNALAFNHSLKNLNISVEQMTNVPPPSRNAWENLRKARPALEARFSISKDLGTTVNMKGILSPGIPLVVLDFCWIDPRSLWRSFCEYIATHFKSHLKFLNITVYSVMLWKDDFEVCPATFWSDGFLDVFIENCLLLEVISITNSVDGSSVEIKRSLRRALARQRANRHLRVILHGVEVNPNETWSDWLQAKMGYLY